MKNIFPRKAGKKTLKVKKLAKALAAFGVVLIASQLVPGGLTSAAEQPIFRAEDDFYKVKNVTQGSGFQNEVTSKKGDVLEFKIYVHNVAPGSLAHDVMVRANLPATASSHTESIGQIGCKDALISVVNDKAYINGPNGEEFGYIEGSTWMHKRLGGGHSEDSKLGNGILKQDGWYINIGNVRGGNGEDWGVDVYFRAKVGEVPQPDEPGVDIYPNRTGQDYPGRTMAYNHTIRNTGDVTDSYNINARSNRGWNLRLSKKQTNPTEPNQTRDLTVWVTIPYNASPNTVDNTVVTVTSKNYPNVSDRVTDQTTVLQRKIAEADLTLVESVDRVEIQRDNPDESAREITYTMSITNIGDKTAVNTVLVSDLGDNLEGNANFISYGGGERQGNDLIYRIGRIDPGQTVERWFVAHAHNDLTDGFVLKNHSMVSYDTEGNNRAEPVSPVEAFDALVWSNWVYTTVRGSALALTVTDNRVFASPGETLNYEVTLRNTETGRAYNVQIVNQVPAELVNIRNISDGGVYDATTGEITWSSPSTLEGNSAHTFTFSGDIALGTAEGTVLRDDATATANNVPSASAYDETVVQLPPPVIALSKTDNKEVTEPGDTSLYEITIVNDGGEAYNVVVTDIVPDYLENIRDISDGGVYDEPARTIIWNLGTLEGVEPSGVTPVTRVLSFRADVALNAPNGFVLVNVATLTADNLTDPVSATDETTILAEPYLNLDKIVAVNGVDASVAYPGDTLTYTLTYSNSGNGLATGVVIQDVIPNYTTYVDGSASGIGVYNAVDQTIVWAIGDLAVSETGSVSFSVTVDSNVPHNYTIRNDAKISADGGYMAEAYVEVRAQHLPGIFVEKRVDKTNTKPGDVLTYTVVFGNRSAYVAAINVVLTDELSSFVTYVNGSATHSGIYDTTNHTLTWNWGTLPPNSQYQVTYQVRVKDDVPNGTIIRNTATLTASLVDPVNHTINSLSETGSVSGTTTTTVVTEEMGLPGSLAKTGGLGLISLIAALLTLLTGFGLVMPKLKRYFAQFRA